MLKPFIFELFSLMIVTSIILICFFYCGFVEVIIKTNLLTVVAIIVFSLLLLINFSRIFNWGIKALIDLITNRTKQDDVVFLSQLPYKASALTEIIDSEYKRRVAIYYLIQCKKDDGNITFISTNYLDFEKGDKLEVYSAPFSKVILKCEKKIKSDEVVR